MDEIDHRSSHRSYIDIGIYVIMYIDSALRCIREVSLHGCEVVQGLWVFVCWVMCLRRGI